jgi:hypothetical protein
MDEREVAEQLTYPVVVFQARYGGTYSGGEWLAIHDGYAWLDALPRVHWMIEFGPGSEDCEAGEFWVNPPDWIAAGKTPDKAVENLLRKAQAKSSNSYQASNRGSV